MASGVFTAFIELEIKRSTLERGEPAGLHINYLRSGAEVAIKLANIFIPLDVGRIRSGTENKPDIRRGVEGLSLRQARQQGYAEGFARGQADGHTDGLQQAPYQEVPAEPVP